MPIDTDFKKQLEDYANQLADSLQSQGDQFRRSSQGQTASNYYTHADAIRGRLKDVLSQVDNAGLGADQLPLIKKAIEGDAGSLQGLNELAASGIQLGKQNQQLANFRSGLENQYFGGQGLSLTQALSNPGGDLGNLNSFLAQQQHDTFQQELKPLLNMQLGAQGLRDSGANIELQAKALGGLERERQSSLMQAALGARSQLSGLQRSDILGDIGARQNQLSNEFDLQRQGLSQDFQMRLENQRADLARELSRNRGGGLLNDILGGVQIAAGVGSMFMGNPMGAGMAANGGRQIINGPPSTSGTSFMPPHNSFLQYAGYRNG